MPRTEHGEEGLELAVLHCSALVLCNSLVLYSGRWGDAQRQTAPVVVNGEEIPPFMKSWVFTYIS